jgi:hypothetical protein
VRFIIKRQAFYVRALWETATAVAMVELAGRRIGPDFTQAMEDRAMAIDAFQESLLSFAEAAKKLGKKREGKKPNLSVFYRWTLGGLRGKDGQIVRLEVLKVGGRTFTSEQALQRFFDRLTGDQSIVTPPTRTRRQRLREIQRAEEVLRAAGI